MYMEGLDMSQDQKMSMMELLNDIEGLILVEKSGRGFRFRMHMNRSMEEASIEALDLSVRSYHCLKRAGYTNIGLLAEDIAAGKKLKEIRNCGSKSAREIMEHLFMFQYYSLKPEKRDSFLKEVISLNIFPESKI